MQKNNDRELLELAAKAAGIELEGDLYGNPGEWMPMYYEGKTYHSWDPLASGEDAFCLAVKLGFNLYLPHKNSVYVAVGFSPDKPQMLERARPDPYAAIRRAIVRAAAEIGRTMP